MRHSLTILLPVKNAQAELNSTVQQLLDVASDLTNRFEVLIVDNGSTDATSEITTELAHNYPQVRSMRLGQSRSFEEAVQVGLADVQGDLVFVKHGEIGNALEQLVDLWRATTPPKRLLCSLHPAATKPSAPRVGKNHLLSTSHYGVIDKRAAKSNGTPNSLNRPNYLEKMRDFAFGEWDK